MLQRLGIKPIFIHPNYLLTPSALKLNLVPNIGLLEAEIVLEDFELATADGILENLPILAFLLAIVTGLVIPV